MSVVKTEGRRIKKSERARVRKEAKKALPQATLRNYRSSASKMRLCIDLIRGKDVQEAVRVLHFSNKRVSEPLLKLLRSAMANADEFGFDVERLTVQQAFVNEGRTLNRWRPRAQGRATRIRKRSCHTTIVLGEAEAGE
jgi:large subunit ribosomal protein L22